MQITGTGAVKMSTSAWWQLWQQDNGSGSYSHKHEQGCANVNGQTQTRAGKHKWVNVNEGGQTWMREGGQVNVKKNRRTRAGEQNESRQTGERANKSRQTWTRVGECEWRWGSNGGSSSNSGSTLPPLVFYFYLVFSLSNNNFYNFYTVGMCDTVGFVRHCTNTGMVWKILTCSIPVRNPTQT